MAAGTVVSGGFPGLVAQEVQPNPKCNGCLHFDGQGGKIGICTIGTKPWNCGDGDHADTGYAPIARGAGKYLPDMNDHGAHAHEVDAQEVGGLYGAGSTRPVTFQQVSLSEEHVHFAKSMIARHDAMQKSMCRLCKSSGNTIGMAPANTGPQVCTCEPIEARTVAKSLRGQLSNLQGELIDLDDLTKFVYDAAKSNFDPGIVKGTFFHAHGKYEVSPAGGGKHHVDFHPKGGGTAARVGTADSHRDARHMTNVHAKRFAQGSTPQQKEAAAVEIAPGWHARAGEENKNKTVANKPKKITFSGSHEGKTGANPISFDKSDDEDEIEKAIDHSKHSHVVTGPYAGSGRGFSSASRARNAADKLDNKYGAYRHTVARNPHYKPDKLKFENSPAHGPGATRAEAGHGQYVTQPEKNGGHNLTYMPHGQGEVGHLHGGWHESADGAHAAAHEHHAKTQLGKSIDIDDVEQLEKSLRFSHKNPGSASTSHGRYHIVANEGGGHTVTYTHKESGKSYAKTFGSHREALGAAVEHHLKNRPPPKPRKKKDPNAPKKAKGAGAAPGGNCPPCP